MSHPHRFITPRLALALARGDRERLRQLVESIEDDWVDDGSYDIQSAVFDALVALGERERIELEGPAWLERGPYVRPFALRALGFAREDDQLVEQALREFDAMGLTWHGQRTRDWKIIG